MSIRLSRKQRRGGHIARRKKGITPYKYYLTKKEIIRRKEEGDVTDWNEELQRAAERAMEVATAVIREDGPKSKPYCVYSEKTGRKFGCYPTRKAAEKRLAQIEMHKHIKKNK